MIDRSKFIWIGVVMTLLLISSAGMSFAAGETDEQYLLFEEHGGTWADSEKLPDNEDDDLMCWAKVVANVLEWTGWGFVDDPVEDFDDADQMYDYIGYHFADATGDPINGWKWWFDGEFEFVEIEGGGGFYPTYNFNDYIQSYFDVEESLQYIDTYLHNGWAVALLVNVNGGHAITCWGYSYDPAVDKTAHPENYYTGIYVTDSDDDKNQTEPPDRLRYYELEYDAVDQEWMMKNYGTIGGVRALKTYPDEDRPIADAGESYVGMEGTGIMLDASASSDPGLDPLHYRWDFENDHEWDTGWSSSPIMTHIYDDDFDGEVAVEVSDGRLRDVATAVVTISNDIPTLSGINLTPDPVNEGSITTISGTIEDTGDQDVFKIEINWGDGQTKEYDYPAGTVLFNESHIYRDDDPTGTSMDNYTVNITIKDDDMSDYGITVSESLTVKNVVPGYNLIALSSVVDENGEASISGDINDPSDLDTFTLEINWGEGDPVVLNYLAGETAFSAVHQYLDDDPTGTPSDNYTVIVRIKDDDMPELVPFYSGTVKVDNLNPSVIGISISEMPFLLPHVMEADFQATYNDIGSLDTHVAEWDWGDTSTSEATIDNGTITGSHVFGAAGEFMVLLTVTDDDTGFENGMLEVHVHDASEALDILNRYIQDLPEKDFKNNADKRKTAFDEVFIAMQEKLADEEYMGLIQSLENNVLDHANDYDSGKSNDWITDETAQTDIGQMVHFIVLYLEYLMEV